MEPKLPWIQLTTIMVLTYYKALDFIEDIYQTIISQAERAIDFEVSIDEVDTPTKPQDHFFVANELNRRGIKVSGVAPRFCGAFEKGIDYIGDITQFEAEFAVHARIAQHFGYKLSIHSGSDKFSVFPIIGKYAKSFHVKTAGTNWLEAVRVIAQENPVLFRELYKAALDSLDAARKYYKVSLDLNKIPDLDQLADVELPQLLDQNDARQLLHITYGFILQNPALREPFYDTLIKCEDRYREFLCRQLKRWRERTPGIGTLALEQIPQRIVEANSTDVDIVTNATVTSKAIIYAVNNALDRRLTQHL